MRAFSRSLASLAALALLALTPLYSSAADLEALAPYPTFSPRKVVLVHLHDGAPFFLALGSLTLSNKARYAARHGYELAYRVPEGTKGLYHHSNCDDTTAIQIPASITGNDSGSETEPRKQCIKPDDTFDIDRRAPTFGKIKLTLAACRTRPGYWVLWTDADAMVVNQSVPLESIIDDRYDIILSVDWLMINAGMILFKCSAWNEGFLNRVYSAREFDDARALDQSAFQHFFDSEPDINAHLKKIPKHAMNSYTEEYRPGDFLLHMAGKLYESTTEGATAIAHQFDMLSMQEDPDDIKAFFNSRYLLNMYSGTCDISMDNSECGQEDDRRIKLNESLGSMSDPYRYRHVALRYHWMPDWKDIYDTEDWNKDSKVFDPSGLYAGGAHLVGGDASKRACKEAHQCKATS